MIAPSDGPLDISNLSPVERTLLVGLIGRAQDSHRTAPVLDDRLARPLLARLEYNRARVRVGGWTTLSVATRSRQLDQAVQDFVALNEDPMVVELGSGLATRRDRIGADAQVDWYDVDLPRVIELRRTLLPCGLPDSSLIAADVTEPGWAEMLPSGRPVILVADGLVSFLDHVGVSSMLEVITHHFVRGEIAFTADPAAVARSIGAAQPYRRLGIPKSHRGFGLGRPRGLEAMNDQLTFVEERRGFDGAVEHQPLRLRATAALVNRWSAPARRCAWTIRCEFGVD